MNIETVLDKFTRLKVLVVGDVMLDTYLQGSVNRISPEAPVPIVSVESRDERPGGAANVALNIKKLGAAPVLCSVIGKDEAGKALLRMLKKNKLDTQGIIISPSRITSVKTRLLSRHHQILRYDSEITTDLDLADERNLIKKIKELISKEKPQALIFEDYDKGVLTPAVIKEIIAYCHAKKILTAVDPKKKNFFSYKGIHLFKPNLREIRDAFNKEISNPDQRSLLTIASNLKKRLSQEITLITLSEQGLFYQGNKEYGTIEAHQRDISDVSGAGDTVIAMATLCLAAGIPLKESATLANIAGGLVCEYAGVVPVTRQMLVEELSKTASKF